LKSDSLFKDLWNNIDSNLKNEIETRNTVLQVLLLESRENPDNFILAANTHFYYHPKADFIRLIQTIVCIKYLERIIKDLVLNYNVSIIFGGDFNSDPLSFAVKYILDGQVPIQDLDESMFILN
jgi:2',5'-phosphodiesterase